MKYISNKQIKKRTKQRKQGKNKKKIIFKNLHISWRDVVIMSSFRTRTAGLIDRGILPHICYLEETKKYKQGYKDKNVKTEKKKIKQNKKQENEKTH